LSYAPRSRKGLHLPRHAQDCFDLDRAGLPAVLTGDFAGERVQAHQVRPVQRFLRPFLAAKGFPRDSYEVVCVFREPIDWLSSWWRYRSREELADPSHQNHCNYAGHVSFEQFTYAYMEGDEQFAQGVGRQSEFLRPCRGKPEVDRVFRYDRLDLLVEFLCEKVGEKVEVGISNVSPERSFSLSEGCERELHEFFALDYRIYKRAIGG
jgi:hypothetical protein